MWEDETVVLVTSLKKRILGGKERVRFKSVSADDGVPTFIKTLFKNRIEDFIAEESPLTIQATPHFDIKPKDLETFRTRLTDVLRETASFGDKEVEKVLREALVLRLNYIVKPVDTMRKMLFEKREKIDVSEMDKVLDSFTKVLPYAERVLEECRRLDKSLLERDDYSRVTTDVLHRLMEEDSVRIVLRDFSALTEFLSETKGEDVSRVEASMIQEFLADRNLWGFRRALDVERKLGKEDFNAVDLEMTLKRYLELKEEFSKADSQETEKVTEKSPRRESELEEVQIEEEKAASEEEDEWDLESVLSEETFSIEAEEDREETADLGSELKSMEIVEEDQKKKEEEPEEVSDQNGDRVKREELENLIEGKTEKAFIKKLFGGDAAEYKHLLDKINEAESWRVAKILIDNELFKRDVDPFSREAIKLVDLVYNRYYPEEGVGVKQ